MRGVGPYRRYCDEHFPCLGRRPGAPKWVPGWCGGGSGWNCFSGLVRVVQGSSAFVKQILVVVDVFVIFSDKFQQSKSHENVEVHQIQFIDRVLDLRVVQRSRGTHSATVQKTSEIPQVLFLDRMMTLVVVHRLVVVTEQKTVVVPQLQSSVKVVDVLVVQVPQFIDGLDVAVIMQRQVVSRDSSLR